MDVPSNGLRKGAWTVEEDSLLRQCIENYGEGTWHKVPQRAGLNRCRKSCRLRWLNYLKPSIKRGRLSTDEFDLLLRLHKLLGNRWSLIAGRLPGRTANDIKNYWNTHLRKKKQEPSSNTKERKRHTTCSFTKLDQKVEVIKPQPRSFSNRQIDEYHVLQENDESVCNDRVTSKKDDDLVNNEMITSQKKNNEMIMDRESMWWESLLDESEEANKVVPQEPESSLMASKCSTFEVEELLNMLNEDSEEV